VGAWILYLIPNVLLVDLADYRLLAYGIVALFIMLIFPDGVVGTLERLFRRPAASAAGLSAGVTLVKKAGPRDAQDRGDSSTPAIEVRGATKRFGSVAALSNIDVTVERGTIHGIVGPNGSGKTTLLNAFSGLIRLDSGRVVINGADIGRLPPHRIPELGVSRTFQTPRIFDDMSIWENLAVGAGTGDGRGANSILAALEPLRAQWQAQAPATLQHAQRRILEVMRAAAMGSEIILLDEPAAGLALDERNELAELLRFLRDHFRTTIVLIEHDLSLVWRVADRITVLDAGITVADGKPAAIRSDPRVQFLFTGSKNA
jgi:branched-chain amino acid transport system permease protein